MKKQLGKPGNRKMYNTDTAKLIAKSRTGGRSAEYRCLELLFRTERGDFFIHGIGGKLTRWNGDEDIIEIYGDALKYWRKNASG